MELNIVEIFALLIFLTGTLGVLHSRNIIKSIISIGIMDIGAVLFFLGINYSKGMVPPIGTQTANMADPVVQALMITAIIIGVAVTALALMMFIVLYHRYGTTNWVKALKARAKEKE